MQIGSYARNNDQIQFAIDNEADFVDLRMDLNHTINFEDARKKLNDAGITCTLHLPSSPYWHPIDISKEILPFVDVAREIDAELATFHTTLSNIFYSDEEIDAFLQGIEPICDAATAIGVELAIENLGLQYAETALFFDKQDCAKLALDIGHGQIMAHRNRVYELMQFFFDRVLMVNVHDNFGSRMLQEVVATKKRRKLSRTDIRAIAKMYDTHLPIGMGEIDFLSIFRELRKLGYDGRFLLLCADPYCFPKEREKFLQLWEQTK